MKLFNFFKKLKGNKENKARSPAKKIKPRPKPKKSAKSAAKTAKKKVQKIPAKRSLKPPAATKEKEIGIVTHYFNKISVGIIKLKTPLNLGDEIHIKGAHDDFTQSVESMQINHQDVLRAPKGAEIGIKVLQRVHQNDKVYFSPQK
jgi:putative protease